jgi:hypothetical protein
MSGIYFLFVDNKIVYIGQSKNIGKRLAAHNIDYDSYRVIPCEIPDLLYYEKRLINYFKPVLNGHPGGKREGAGRKVGSYFKGERKESVVMRIPESLIPKVQEYIRLFKSGVPANELERVYNENRKADAPSPRPLR